MLISHEPRKSTRLWTNARSMQSFQDARTWVRFVNVLFFLFANLQIPPTEITMRAPCKITWFWSKIHFLNISLTNEPNHWGCDHCILSSTFSNMFLENIQNGFLLGLPGWWDVSVWDSLKTWDEYNNLSLSA